jgi:HSP20 family protein
MAFRHLVPWRKRRHEGEPLVPAPREIEDFLTEAFEHPFRSWMMAPWRRATREVFRFTPDVDVAETDKEYRVTAELPGLSKDDIEISLEEGTLTISGEKREEKKEEKENYWRTERSYGSFVRRIPLPTGVNEDAVEASFKDGVLTITLPKTEETRGKKVEIKGT